MTIKRYTFDTYYDSEESPIDIFEECEFGEYVEASSLLKRLKEIQTFDSTVPGDTYEAFKRIRQLIKELE